MSDAARTCGPCSLCCTVLRVDELKKLGGVDCVHQRAEGGCGIHPTRPDICRAYSCLWLGGGLGDDDRPDRLGAVLDVVARGGEPWLDIREAQPGVFDTSERLQEIAAEFRVSMPVRIGDTASVLDADRAFRVLLPGGEERHVAGDTTIVRRDGQPDETLRLPLLERGLRRLRLRWQRWRLSDYRGR